MNLNYSIAIGRSGQKLKAIATGFDHSEVLAAAAKADTDKVDIYKGGVHIKTVDPKAMAAQAKAEADRAAKLKAAAKAPKKAEKPEAAKPKGKKPEAEKPDEEKSEASGLVDD